MKFTEKLLSRNLYNNEKQTAVSIGALGEEAAVKALNKGGMIILDDSDRINTSQEYVKAVEVLKNADLLQVDFYGFCPMNNYTKTTSVFFSRDFNFESLYKVQPINGWGNLWSKSRKDRKEFYKKSM